MKHIVLGAAALLAIGVVGCESNNHVHDNDPNSDHMDRTTSARIDSGTVSNDRMNSGNPNDRTGRTSSGVNGSSTIDRNNAGIDRAGSSSDNTGIGTGSSSSTSSGAGSNNSGRPPQ